MFRSHFHTFLFCFEPSIQKTFLHFGRRFSLSTSPCGSVDGRTTFEFVPPLQITIAHKILDSYCLGLVYINLRAWHRQRQAIAAPHFLFLFVCSRFAQPIDDKLR